MVTPVSRGPFAFPIWVPPGGGAMFAKLAIAFGLLGLAALCTIAGLLDGGVLLGHVFRKLVIVIDDVLGRGCK